MSNRRKDREAALQRDRSRSPVQRPSETLTEDDLRRIVSETMKNQIPTLIMEASKVVMEQLATESQDAQTKSFSSFTQEMKQLKARQEEVSYEAKAAALKTEGIFSVMPFITSYDVIFYHSIVFIFQFIHILLFLFEETNPGSRVFPQ